MSPNLLIIPVLVSAFYCLMVCVCIVGRMDRHTSGAIRWPIVALGAVSAWAILRTVEGGWQPGLTTYAQAAVLVGGAIFLAVTPKIKT